MDERGAEKKAILKGLAPNKVESPKTVAESPWAESCYEFLCSFSLLTDASAQAPFCDRRRFSPKTE